MALIVITSNIYCVSVAKYSTAALIADPPVPPVENKCCPENEVYSDNISPCGNTCENIGRRCHIFTFTSSFAPIKGCDCIKGFARLGENGRCVKIESRECIQRYPPSVDNCALKPNEEFLENTYYCQIVCETLLDGPCEILSLIPISDCHCKRGYARYKAGGTCVPIRSKDCLRRIKTPASCGK